MIIQAKQVSKLISGYINVPALSFPAASSVNATTGLTAAAATAGSGGGSVPVRPAVISTASGFVTVFSNRVEVINSATRNRLSDNSGNEVFGRLTHSAGVYTITLYSTIAGVETAYTLGEPTSLDLRVPYLFSFDSLPHDFTLRQIVNDDPKRGGVMVDNLDGTYTWTADADGTSVIVDGRHYFGGVLPTDGNFEGRTVYAFDSWFIYISNQWFQIAGSSASDLYYPDALPTTDNFDGRIVYSFDTWFVYLGDQWFQLSGGSSIATESYFPDELPTTGNYEGRIAYSFDSWFVYLGDQWFQLSGGTSGATETYFPDALPTTGNFEGRIVYSIDSWFVYDGGQWFQLAGGATAPDLYFDTTLPTTDNYEGRMAFVDGDGWFVYRADPGVWVQASEPAVVTSNTPPSIRNLWDPNVEYVLTGPEYVYANTIIDTLKIKLPANPSYGDTVRIYTDVDTLGRVGNIEVKGSAPSVIAHTNYEFTSFNTNDDPPYVYSDKSIKFIEFYWEEGDFWREIIVGGAHSASDVTIQPSGSISSTNVQAAINELAAEKVSQTSGLRTGGAPTTVGNLSVLVDPTTKRPRISAAVNGMPVYVETINLRNGSPISHTTGVDGQVGAAILSVGVWYDIGVPLTDPGDTCISIISSPSIEKMWRVTFQSVGYLGTYSAVGVMVSVETLV